MPVFNVARGMVRYYAQIPDANGGLFAALFKAASQSPDTTMADFATLAAIKASNTEADFTNYSRQPLTSVASPGGTTIAPDMVNDILGIKCGDVTWLSAGGTTNNSLGRIVFYYNPNTTTSGNDASCVPLTFYQFATTTDGTNRVAQINQLGFWRSQ